MDPSAVDHIDDDDLLAIADHSDDNIDFDPPRHSSSPDMAAAVAQPPQPLFQPPSTSPATSAKRYRPAPAKTFQCRGYGECRMVFSRSEHLARHIRKHTGERPFTCHCGKQFSRLDNLRQHAQTVHADKQDQNERMMQELTSLHANMTAAGKGAPRGKRGAQAAAAAPSGAHALPSMTIKEEDGIPMSMRPGTSTGYEGGDDFFRGSHSTHSFRDPGQSFRVPPALSLHQQHAQHAGQSFLAPASTPFSFSLPDIGGGGSRPGTSSRPATAASASGTAGGDRSLPPISAVVAASGAPSLALPPALPPLFVPQQREQHGPPLTSSHILPLPTPSGPYAAYRGRRPSTATRPGTAPASYYYGAAGPGATLPPLVAARPELSLSLTTAGGRRDGQRYDYGNLYRSSGDGPGDEPTSPAGGAYDSPFSFHAPASSTPSSATFPADAAALANPRKRPYTGSDDGDGDEYRERGDVRPYSSGRRPATSGAYEYGSESRPQSRRLSVMELCNDPVDEPPARPFVPLPGPAPAFGASRPTTSSGLVSSASQLALYDRTPSPLASGAPAADALLARTPPPAARAAAPAAGAPGGGGAAVPGGGGPAGAHAAQVGGGTLPAAHGGGRGGVLRRDATPQPAARSPVLSGVRWAHGGSPGRSGAGSPGAGYGWRGVSRSPAGSVSPPPAAGGSPSGESQVRVSVGMRA
ncbi:hypothetical protein PHLGIDRAFT_291717 [Phlebiopsis gigantea 11061_1 CR5-6]|uniref:C2H2-type domain-containing protein n=1 Tax=Phlebiopsis gigantea (strain 11061_1 CR5-6) TaxID=745531 RepID=A0A0C3RR75_PHLG1|nr:hypothetical protein PHLGIDRAFT_291717 [Phlebiopsis gigantea 11061_1 CR5-6]